MAENTQRLTTTASEFHDFDDPIGDLATVGEFWQWAMSDLLGNRNRGIMAEYIVGRLIGADMTRPRLEWDFYDLLYRDYKIEVKSSAYVQTWHQSSAQRSTLSFGVAPHIGWDAVSNTLSSEKRRWVDVYVFCVFPAERHSECRDVLDLDQWRFYVTTTQHLEACLPPNAKVIGLARVQAICGKAVQHTELKAHIDSLLQTI